MQAKEDHTSLNTLVCMEISQKFVQELYEESGGHERIDFAIVQLQDRLMMIQGRLGSYLQIRLVIQTIGLNPSSHLCPPNHIWPPSSAHSQEGAPGRTGRLSQVDSQVDRAVDLVRPSRLPSRQGCRLGYCGGNFPALAQLAQFPSLDLNLKICFYLEIF